MTEPQEFTAQQAADPSTPAQTLADIAALRPDLRPAVAANPSAYPGLLEWLGALGDPQVDAALAARTQAPAAPEVPPAEQTQAYGTPTTPGQAPYGAEQALPPYGTEQPQAPYGADQQQAPYGADQTLPPYGADQTLPPYGAEQQQAPYGAPGGPAYPYAGQPGAQPGQYPGQPYGQQPMAGYAGTPPKKSNTGKIVLIVVGVLVVIGVLIGVAFAILGNILRTAGDQIQEELESISESYTEFEGSDGDGTYGSDAYLDGLWDACTAEDWQACDDLFFESPVDSEYEEYGRTCGGRTDGQAYCVDELGNG